MLPGVTVEAASAALIEKVRTAVTDGSGQYRITDLAPGTYTVTYSLPGFTRVVREGVAITGSGVITINADLRVGALQETITVTGETPVVDVQSTRREMVITAETLATAPVTRSYGSLLAAIPGITTDNTSRGAMTEPFMTFFTANGGPRQRRTHADQRHAGGGVVQRRRRLHVHLRRGQHRRDAGAGVGRAG